MRQTLTNTHSKAYKHLVASCFQQTMTPSEDVVYYMDVAAPAGPVSDQAAAHLGQTLHDVFVGHCRRRGAIPFQVRVPTFFFPRVSIVIFIGFGGESRHRCCLLRCRPRCARCGQVSSRSSSSTSSTSSNNISNINRTR